MLRVLKLQNYRCFRAAEVELGPLTVLVGPNASGKTALLNALMGGSPTPRDGWRGAKKQTITVAGELRDGSHWNAFERERPYHGTIVHFQPEQLRLSQQVDEQKELFRDGSNLVNVFASLPRRVQAEVARELATLVPAVGDVDARPRQKGEHRLVFNDPWAAERWYEPTEVSDGTLLTLAYLVLARQANAPQLLAVEEPERGLHPYLIEQVVDLLYKLSRGELGRAPIQIVVATHSVAVLDFVRPEDVRFLDREESTGEVRIRRAPTDEPGWGQAIQAYENSVGQMWLSGGLGGVPGR